MQDQLQDFLKQNLKDIQAPAELGIWPLAPVWWLLAGVLLLTLIIGIMWHRRQQTANAYRKIASQALTTAYQQWQLTGDTHQYLNRANNLLRRCILHIQGNEQIAGRSGEAWLSLLNAATQRKLSATTADALTIKCYQPTPQVDIDLVHHDIKAWIKAHQSASISDTCDSTFLKADNV